MAVAKIYKYISNYSSRILPIIFAYAVNQMLERFLAGLLKNDDVTLCANPCKINTLILWLQLSVKPIRLSLRPNLYLLWRPINPQQFVLFLLRF